MFDQHDQVIRYKWNKGSGSGFRLRYDALDQAHCFRIEDCTHHVVMDNWGCASLDEALELLGRFFDLDVAEERRRIAAWLPARIQ